MPRRTERGTDKRRALEIVDGLVRTGTATMAHAWELQRIVKRMHRRLEMADAARKRAERRADEAEREKREAVMRTVQFLERVKPV